MHHRGEEPISCSRRSLRPLRSGGAICRPRDGSDYDVFYNRGIRFWWAIDHILTIKPNPSGKLAALLQQTDGFAGVDWKDPKSIARFFDEYSIGRASSVVQCYLVDDACDAANP